jgi:curli production assembly/transport component CsgG
MNTYHTYRKILKGIALLIAGLTMTACTTVPASHKFLSKEPVMSQSTKSQVALKQLTPPTQKVTVAVYGFQDKTGQFKPTEAGQTLSRAVTQGGEELLIKALQDAGNRSWFTIIERSNLNNLLKERQIITEMRQRYLGETTINSQALPPLLFAGVLFEGGIVGFDTNTLTGGFAARYLGIGGKTDYRQNVVTVNLRAVSVKTGEVLASVTTEKTVSSVGVAANAFRFVTFDNLLEVDTGVTSNEPGVLALRQAIEKSVYALIMEGSEIGLWNFQDRNSGQALLNNYRSERGDFAYAPTASTAVVATEKQPSLKKQAEVKAVPVRVEERFNSADDSQTQAANAAQRESLKLASNKTKSPLGDAER